MNQALDRTVVIGKAGKWFGNLFVFAGLCLLVYGLAQTYTGWRSTGWSAASGYVVSSEVVGSGKGRRPEIKYEYTVNGRGHTGDRILIGPDPMGGGMGIPSPGELIRRYPEGKAVRVFYDPDDPIRSVLEPGIGRIPVLLTAIGVFFLLLGTVIRRRVSRDPPHTTRSGRDSGTADLSVDDYQKNFLEDRTQEGIGGDPAGRWLAFLTLLSFIAAIGCVFWPQDRPWLAERMIVEPTIPSDSLERGPVARGPDAARTGKLVLPDTAEPSPRQGGGHKERQHDLPGTRPPANAADPGGNAERIRVAISEDFSPLRMHTLGNWQPLTTPLLGERPEGIIQEPQYQGSIRKYGRMQLGTGGNRTYFFVLDVIDNTHPVLYFDGNQNGDLTDDGEPLANQGTGWFATEVNLPMRRLVRELDTDAPYSIWLFVNEYSRRKGYANHYSRTKMKGSVSINNRNYLAYVGETGINDADFTNDGIYVDLNSNGKIERNSEYVGPGQSVRINGREYAFDIGWGSALRIAD